jgi:uncharacterized protein (DUF1697 family)
MSRYAVFLRGINVGGNAIISMASLKQLLTAEGYKQVDTFLNSGNVILETEKNKIETEIHIREIIEQQCGLTIAIFVKSKDDLEFIVANNPFDADTEADNSKRMVVMFHEIVASGEKMTVLKDDKEDADYYLKGDLIYIYYKVGVGRAKVTNPTIKQFLKQVSTSRNWNTITKILKKIT